MFKSKSTVVKDEDEDRQLRSGWTRMFLEHKGFQYILKVFMEKDVAQKCEQLFELKHFAFLLKLLRIFIMAAFSTSKEAQVYTVASLVRKSSTVQEDPPQEEEGSRFKELQTLLEGTIGTEIIQQIDYSAL